MDKLTIALIIVVALILGFFALNSYIYNEKQGDSELTMLPEIENSTPYSPKTEDGETPLVKINPISHATSIIQWNDKYIYTDPTGGSSAFEGQPSADIILITDIHGDHYSPETLNAVLGDAILIAPQAVIDMMPDNLSNRATAMENAQTEMVSDFYITAVPMYNLPESDDSRHTKGRGNGYIIEQNGFRVYVAGDTAGIPEMRSLTEVDIALVPMNLPYTMGVEDAADAVLDFAPKQVYPYHYRGEDGLADVEKFRELVNAGKKDIDVVLLDWYPE